MYCGVLVENMFFYFICLPFLNCLCRLKYCFKYHAPKREKTGLKDTMKVFFVIAISCYGL